MELLCFLWFGKSCGDLLFMALTGPKSGCFLSSKLDSVADCA